MTSARKVQPRAPGWSQDMVLGVLGGGLALASAAFGVVMTLHGPVASWGNSGAFTVFEQLAPKDKGHHAPSTTESNELDLTETASIPKAQQVASERAVIPSVTLQAASESSATIAFAGHVEVVHVGDDVPGAGKVLAIVPGAKALIRTSRGLIVSTEAP